MLRFVCAIALATSASSVADARRPRVQPSIAGTWDSTYGEVRVTQQGDRIHGEYACCGGGTVDGYVTGALVKFHWREPRGAGEGEGVWRIQRDGTLQGSWGMGQSDSNGSAWNLWRTRLPKQIEQ